MSEAIDLKHLPDTLDLPKARWRIVLMLVVSLAFVLAGFFLTSEHDSTSWLVIGVFGFCFVVFALMLFARSGVTLDRDGFTHHAPFGAKRYAWGDVSEFTHKKIGRTRMILFNDASKVDTLLSRINRSMLGYNASISTALIGGSLDTACATMNAFRARALGRGS